MQRNNYIIGGGLSGLIFNYYHPEFQIITPETGGFATSTNLVWLHDTPETNKFLNDLDVSIIKQKSYIGYFQGGCISEELTPELNLLLIQKKMTNWDRSIDKSFIPKTFDMSLTDDKTVNYMNTLDVDWPAIVKQLKEKANITCGEVVCVNKKTITTDKKDLTYDKLISTIPAPVFWDMIGEVREFRSTPITNIITRNKPKMFDDKFSIVYYDDTVPYTRVSRVDDLYSYEFTGFMPQDTFMHRYPDIEIENYMVVRHGRIFENGENEPPQDNITFLGRFASWKYGKTVEHIIKQSLEY